MFESSIVNKLSAETNLVALLNTYNGSPSIFSNEAPEDADFPYIVLSIDGSDTYGAVQEFDLYIEYMDYYESRANAREAAFWIDVALDDTILTHDRFIDLRIYHFSGPDKSDAEDDPRSIRIELQYTVRATRSKYLINAK